MRKRCGRMFVIGCIGLMLTGCRGSMELNEVHIVHTVAVDLVDQGRVRITAEIARLRSGQQQPQGMNNETFYQTGEGKSLFDAARMLRVQSERTLLWGHTTAIILSKDAAEHNLEGNIEDIRRLRQFRNSTLVFIMDGKAYDVLKVSMPNVSISSQALRGLSEGGGSTALTQQITLIDVYRSMLNRYEDIRIPGISIVKNAVDPKVRLLQTIGLYTFSDSQLAGFMRANETKGYLRASGGMVGAVETLACGEKQTITFENINNHSRVQVHVDDKRVPQVIIEISADLNLTSKLCTSEEVTPMTIADWERQLNDKISENVDDFIRFSNKHKVDLLGLGERIHRRNPKLWKKMKGDWERILPTSRYSVEVHTRIDHTNFIT